MLGDHGGIRERDSRAWFDRLYYLNDDGPPVLRLQLYSSQVPVQS